MTSRSPNPFYNEFDLEPFRGQHSAEEDRHPFQVDRDRILFSYPFRRLQSKTQVFQSGAYDFYRTRLTHTIEVARIARSICDSLRKHSPFQREDFHIDPDLVEGIGMAHDIGHPPFGHIGERKLNALMAPHGGFEGNAQTARMLTQHFFHRTEHPIGMNPSRAFLDGTLKYKNLFREMWHSPTQETPPQPPANHFLYNEQEPVRAWVLGEDLVANAPPETDYNAWKSIECQIMDWADDAAYSLHDIVDGVHAGFLTLLRLEQWAAQANLDADDEERLGELLNRIRDASLEAAFARKVGRCIRACSLQEREHPLSSRTNRYRFTLAIDPALQGEAKLHKRIAYELIFRSSPIQQVEFKGGFLLERLFQAAYASMREPHAQPRVIPDPYGRWIDAESEEGSRVRLLCDYLSGLTDGAAVRAYKRLYDADYSALDDWS